MKIEKMIGDRLREKSWTLSVAESCTGGLVCDRITNVPGSSDYFMGGMVTYSNWGKSRYLAIPLADIKRYGPVSHQVAEMMARGIRKAFHTTFGLSVTGVAGPKGGTEETPVGLVFIGLADGRRVFVRKETFEGSRRVIKKEAAEQSLKFLYDYITQNPTTPITPRSWGMGPIRE